MLFNKRKILSGIILCLFVINNITWACPASLNSTKSTLATPSVFNPIIDAIRQKPDDERRAYAKRVEQETAFIIEMAWRGLHPIAGTDDEQYANPHVINASLDEQYDRASSRRYAKLLKVITNPRKLDTNRIEICIRTMKSNRMGREFKITVSGKRLEDIVEIASANEIAEIQFQNACMAPDKQAQLVEYLNKSSLIEKTLKRCFGLEYSKAAIAKVTISEYDFSATMRRVYLVTVYAKNRAVSPINFIMKISIDDDSDFNTIVHEAVTVLINERLGNPMGYIGALPDRRLVITGPLYHGEVFDDLIFHKGGLRPELEDEDFYKMQVAVVKEAVSTWKKLGGVFIVDPHRRQFIIVRDSSNNFEAHLIDKGYVRLSRSIPLSLQRAKDGELYVVADDGTDLYDLQNWLVAFDENHFVLNLMDNIRLPTKQNPCQFHLEESCIVDGVIQALGREEAINFFKSLVSNTWRKERRKKLDDTVKRLLPEVFAAQAEAGTGTAVPETEFSPLTREPKQDKEKTGSIQISQEHNFLNRAFRCLNDYPVIQKINLSLIPEEDLELNMRTWAHIIALHNQYKLNVNYLFESTNETYRERALHILFREIDTLRPLDKDKLKRRITDNPHKNDARKPIEAHILKEEELKALRELKDTLFVAMSEGNSRINTPLRDFMAASDVALAQVACRKARMDDEENGDTSGKGPILMQAIQDVLPRVQAVYKRLLPHEEITKYIVTKMISRSPRTRKNLAIALALPPILRDVAENLIQLHEGIQELMRAL